MGRLFQAALSLTGFFVGESKVRVVSGSDGEFVGGDFTLIPSKAKTRLRYSSSNLLTLPLHHLHYLPPCREIMALPRW